jgi:hypothetical protein
LLSQLNKARVVAILTPHSRRAPLLSSGSFFISYGQADFESAGSCDVESSAVSFLVGLFFLLRFPAFGLLIAVRVLGGARVSSARQNIPGSFISGPQSLLWIVRRSFTDAEKN